VHCATGVTAMLGACCHVAHTQQGVDGQRIAQWTADLIPFDLMGDAFLLKVVNSYLLEIDNGSNKDKKGKKDKNKEKNKKGKDKKDKKKKNKEKNKKGKDKKDKKKKKKG
jgi:hypothetical protein